MEKQIFKIVVTTSENNVQIVIDVDKEKFKQIIEPLLIRTLRISEKISA